MPINGVSVRGRLTSQFTRITEEHPPSIPLSVPLSDAGVRSQNKKIPTPLYGAGFFLGGAWFREVYLPRVNLDDRNDVLYMLRGDKEVCVEQSVYSFAFHLNSLYPATKFSIAQPALSTIMTMLTVHLYAFYVILAGPGAMHGLAVETRFWMACARLCS